MRKVSAFLLLTILFVSFTCSFVGFTVLPAYGSGENWLLGWTYRRSHVISAASGSGTNYQLQVVVINASGSDSSGTVYINNKTRSDFGDIRFTKSDGSTLLDYWQDGYLLYSQKNSTFWVENSDDLTSVASTIYVYYGNSSVTTTSSGTNTFLFFDDFSGDLSKWTVNAGTWSITSGTLHQTVLGSFADIYATGGNWTSISYIFHWQVASGVCDSGPLVSYQTASTGYYLERGASTFWLYEEPGNVARGTNASLAAPGTSWHTFTTIVNGSVANQMNISFYDNGVLDFMYGAGKWVNGTVGLSTWPGTANPNVYFDDAGVRKYVFPEPAHSTWGIEEVVSLGQNLAFTLPANSYVSAYNLIARGFGFQSANAIVPSSTGYFWKSLPFEVTGAIKLYESTSIYRALAFLASGVFSFFSSVSKAVGLAFQPSVSIVPSSTGYLVKAIGFQATNMVQSFVSVTMQNAMGFLSSEVTNVWSSLSKANALSFQSDNSILPSSTSVFSKALVFQTAEVFIPSSANYFWKALGFQATGMIQTFESTSMLKSIGFLSTGIINIFDYSAMSKAVSFQVLEVQRSENIFPSATGYFWKAIGFQPTNTINAYDAASMGNGLGFLTSGIVNGFSNIQKGMELAFQSTSAVRLWDSSAMLKALGFEVPGTTRLFDSRIMNKAIGLLGSATVNVYSLLSKAMELAFTPSGIIYPVAYGTSGKETATILIEHFELAKLFSTLNFNFEKGFSNYEVIQPLANLIQNRAVQFSVDGLVNLFVQASLSIGRLFNTFENINSFAALGLGKELSFNVYGLSQIFDNLGIAKSIRLTFFELSGLIQTFVTLQASFVLLSPSVGVGFIIAAFGAIIALCMPFILYVQRGRSKPNNED